MTKRKDEYYTDTYSDEAAGTETVVEEQTLPEVPEGLDEAIFRQGWLDARKTAGDAIERLNAFAEGTPQADAWQAGHDAFGV